MATDPSNCRPILLTDALFCQLATYPSNCHPILPTDALICQLTPYPANWRLIRPTAVLGEGDIRERSIKFDLLRELWQKLPLEVLPQTPEPSPPPKIAFNPQNPVS